MFNKKFLHPADILLFRVTSRSTFLDRFIVLGQKIFYHVSSKAKYYHVALVDKDTNLILEAKWPKITRSNLDNVISSEKNIIEVYRIKNITEEQQEKILNWAQEHVGDWYSLSLLLFGWTFSKHSQVCSTYVSKSCNAANLDIPVKKEEGNFVIPDDYYKDPGVEKIM